MVRVIIFSIVAAILSLVVFQFLKSFLGIKSKYVYWTVGLVFGYTASAVYILMIIE
jgi:hypothetical protein